MFLNRTHNPTALDILNFAFNQPMITRQKDTFKVNIKENTSDYEVTVNVPGVQKEDLDIKLKSGVLSISYKHEEETKKEESNEDGKFLLKEYSTYSSYATRKLDFGDSVNGEVKAKLENGVLILNLAKTNPDKEEKLITIE